MTARAGITLAAVVMALSACASAPQAQHPRAARHPEAARHPQAARPAPARTPVPGTNASCGPPPPRHAWAVEVTTAGRIRWQTPLSTRTVDVSPTLQPIPFGRIAVFAQDGTVHGLSLTDGHQLWAWTGGQAVYGMWRWQNLVAVLTDQVSDHSKLTGLDAATGAVRWTLRLPARGLLGNQAATADGGLAMITTGPGVLAVVNLADGIIRWQRRVPASPGLTAAGHLVIFGGNGRLTGYDDLTGRPAWTASGLPEDPAIQMAGGLALVTSNEQGGRGDPTALTAVVPATGRIAWRFDPGQPVTVLSPGPAGLAVTVYYNRQLYLLDPATGRPRWQAGTFVAMGTLPLVTPSAVIAVEGQQPARLVARDAADGRVIWQDTLAQPPIGNQQVTRAGAGNALVPEQPGRPGEPAPLYAYDLTSGKPAWQASLPTLVTLPPLPVPGGFLLQPADAVYACPV
jgi:outer membrane protein assembly factor BamB